MTREGKAMSDRRTRDTHGGRKIWNGEKRNRLRREHGECSKDCLDDKVEGTDVQLLLSYSSLTLFSVEVGEVEPSTVRLLHLSPNLHFQVKIMAIGRMIHPTLKGLGRWGLLEGSNAYMAHLR